MQVHADITGLMRHTTTVNNRKRGRRCRALFAASTVAGSVLLTSVGHAAVGIDTWQGNSSVFWNAAGNWSPATNAPPTTNDGLLFGSAGSSGATLTDNLTAPGSFNISSITFNSSAPAYTINPGSGSNGWACNGSSSIINNSGSIETINDPIKTAAGNGSSCSSTVAGGSIILGGVISGGGGVTVGTGAGTVQLTNPNNSFTTIVAVGGSTLTVPGIGNASTNSITGNNTQLQLGYSAGTGVLNYTGSGENTNKAIYLQNGSTNGGTIIQSGTGVLDFTAALAYNSTGNKTLGLSGSTSGIGVFAGAIGGSNISITKTGSGQWNLSNQANSYGGVTTITSP